MTETSGDILSRFQSSHSVAINLTLRPEYYALLAALGNPQDRLPPVFHVAGTNGKGSTCAFLRAIANAARRKAHVYTSPHLVHFHERIRVADALVTEEKLVALLNRIEKLGPQGAISVFEAGTAAALAAFAETPADIAILEVGLGGRLDATNVVEDPAADIITRLSFDHRSFLGDTMEKIAREKAGIMRRRVPCYVAPQPSTEAMLALRDEAERRDVPLIVGGEDWRIEAVDEKLFRFIGPERKIEALPRPKLVGTHQLWNAGLAIAASASLPFAVSDDDVRRGMDLVDWPGRLQHLTEGKLLSLLPEGGELWLDGGHNDSAGEVLAAQARRWMTKDGKKLRLVYAMLSSKEPEEFLSPLLPYIDEVHTMRVDGDVPGIDAAKLADSVRSMGVSTVSSHETLASALKDWDLPQKEGRILLCGSLYLVGLALKDNA